MDSDTNIWIPIVSTVLWSLALSLALLTNMKLRRRVDLAQRQYIYMQRWKDIMTACYRAESSNLLSQVGLLYRQQQQLKTLAPNMELEEIHESSPALEQAKDALAQLAKDGP